MELLVLDYGYMYEDCIQSNYVKVDLLSYTIREIVSGDLNGRSNFKRKDCLRI